MTRHPELPERDRRILGALVQAYIDQGNRSPRCGWPAAASGCRRPPFATSWPGSKSTATCSSRTPRPGACRPTSATAATSTSCWPSGAPRARARRRSAAAPRRHASRTAVARLAGAVARVASGRLRDCSGRRGDASSTSTSCRSTARKVLVVIVSTGGHISHKVIEPTEPYGIDRAAAGGQLPERRVQGALAAARSARRCSIGCARSGRSTTS